MVLFLLLVLVAVALGIIGSVAESLGYLLVIGIVLFVVALAVVIVRGSRRAGRRPLR